VIVSSGHESSIISSVEHMAQAYGVRVLGSIAKPATRAKLAAVLGNYPAACEAAAAIGNAMSVSEGLPEALRRGDIVAWFQPKVDIATGRVVGAEALARWVGLNGGALLPDRFLPDAERLGLMPALTDAIVEQSCKACAAWRAQGIDATVSFNMTPAALAVRGVADVLTATVQAHGLKPSDVIVEITEYAAANELGPILETLTRLRMRGFGLSIDDFGTGYASMQQLTRMPFTELKIDQAFVKGASVRRASRAVVESSIEIAAKLRLKTVAEGVETDAEWKLVRELGCEVAQGWLMGKAMPLSGFIDAARPR
jgi:EAL domain-containing protein (putative c-di-GMP-specific phosphodiesterase class I)